MVAIIVIALAAILLASSAAVFILKKIMHAVIALTLAFTSSALIFIYLGETMIGLLQLFIFVGGLSTYLIVVISNEDKGKVYGRLPAFIAVAAITTVVMLFAVGSLPQSLALTNNNMIQTAPDAFEDYYPLLYALAALLFSAAAGTVLFIKKFVKLLR
jgi:NADH:ubiquinone oxidoreductase subunit 6 (subunit J)